MSIKTIVIDPVSTEVNRGSYCYDPYLVASLLDVELIENGSVEILGNIWEQKKHWIIGLWSYPQIDFAKWASWNLKGKVSFVGYKPLIEKLGFNFYNFDVKKALEIYPYQFHRFKNILLSDCDLHLNQQDDKRQVYPLFLSYGCSYDCSFCSTAVNCGRKIIHANIEAACKNIKHLGSLGNIHFTDESFFLKSPRYLDKIYEAMDGSFKWITLTTAKDFHREIKRVGCEFLSSKGLSLAEVGYESFDESIRTDMKKRDNLSDIKGLLNCDIPKLWLTVTFYPGETIDTLHQSGKFLKKYGFEPNQLVERIVTNSTVGGLGQYFQPYTGTSVKLDGVFINDRPIRLMPSFLPNSFLNEIPRVIKNKPDNFQFWLDVYNIEDYGLELFTNSETVRKIIKIDPGKISVYIALLSRFGCLESVGTKKEKTEFKTYEWEY